MIGDRRTGDAEGLQLDRVRPLLVVEDESFGVRSAEPPRSIRHVSVARQSPDARRAHAGFARRRISQRLARVSQRFDVHILVTNCQLVEIKGVIGEIAAGEVVALPFQNIGQIGEGGAAIRQV